MNNQKIIPGMNNSKNVLAHIIRELLERKLINKGEFKK